MASSVKLGKRQIFQWTRLVGLALWTLVGCSSSDGGGFWGGKTRGGKTARGGDVVGTVSLAATARPPVMPPEPLPPQGLEAITGFGRVGMDGVYHYTIPIVVPPGRAGMTPEVELAYSSSAGNGTVGVGWSLKAGSMISRCDAVPASGGIRNRVEINSGGQYCLDGQRLVHIAGTGVAGQVNAQYRTEVESFSRIKVLEANGQGPIKWSVERKDGRILTYGTLPETVLPPGPWTQRRIYTPLGILQSAVTTVAMFWPLVEEKDRFTNQILYEYERSNDSNTGSAMPILKKITYGRCVSCGYPNTKDRTVRFTYSETAALGDDDIERWVNGVPIRTTKRLFQISTATWDTTTETTLRRYTLEYLPETNRVTKRNLLRAISACDGAASQACTPRTRFNWQATAPNGYRQHGGGYNGFTYEGNLDNTHLMETLVFDANSDGNDDVLLYEPSAPGTQQTIPLPDQQPPIIPVSSTTYTPKILLGDGGGHFSSAVNVSLSNQPYPCFIYQPSRSIPMDLDGNGTTELVVECARTGQQVGQPVTATYRVLSWQGTPGALSEVTVEGLTGKVVENHQTVFNVSCAWMSSGILRFADITGDGLPEMLSGVNNGTWKMQVAEKILQVGTAPKVRYGGVIDTKLRAIGPDTCQAPMSVTSILDQDGDGHAELAQIDMDQAIRSYTRVPWSTSSHGYNFFDVRNNVAWSVERETAAEPISGTNNWGTANFQVPTGVRPWYFADINGDGLKDALYQAGSNWNTRINTGTGYVGPVTLPAGAVTTALNENTYDPNAWWQSRKDHGIQIADMNGDGRDDIVLFASPNNDQPWASLNLRWRRSIDPVRILYSNGTGFNAPVALSNLANDMIWAQKPRPGAPQFAMSGLGDVNGDGLTDVVGMITVSGTTPRRKLVTWSYGDALPGGVDRMKSVQIEGISEDFGIVDAAFYDNLSSNSVARNAGLATWDTHAPKRGGDFPAASTARGTVVKRHFSQGRNAGKQTVTHWRYSGGVRDKTGRGFVGFAEVKVMNLLTGVFTKHTFDQNPTAVGPGGSYRHYPLAREPVATQTWDAVDSSMQPAPDNFYGLSPAAGTVLTQRRNVSMTHSGHPLRLTWKSVVVNDFHAPNGRPPYSSIDVTPYESTTTTFDAWGNPTTTVSEYTDFSTSERKTYTKTATIEFTNNETAWLIGRPRLVTETTATKNPYQRELENGDTGIYTETSSVEFQNDATTGKPNMIIREPKVIADNPNTTAYEPGDPTLRMTRTIYNSAGLVTTIREQSAARTTCTTQPCGCNVDADCATAQGQLCYAATAGAVKQCFNTRTYGFEYDASGTFIEGFTNPLGQKRWELYDPKRLWLYATVDENDVKTQITRDTFGRPRVVLSDTGAGETISYETSDMTRILRVAQNGGPSSVTFFDVYGRPEYQAWSTFSGGSGVMRETYDVLGNVRERSYKASTAATGTMTRSTAVSAAVNGSIVLSARYDTAGRPVSSASTPTAAGTTYTYPALGTVVETDAVGLRTDTVTDHTGRITKRLQYTAGAAAKSVTYRYKGNGALAMLSHSVAGERFLYDAAGRLRIWRTTNGEDEYLRWAGTYNGFDQLVSETRDNVTTSYTYDKLDRMKSRIVGGELYAYQWDPPGGVGHLDYAATLSHVITFSDFDRGRPRKRTESFDNDTTKLSFGYTYDNFGRLDTLRYPEATSADVTAVARNGIRPGPTVKYNYQNGQLLSITEPSNGNAKLWEATERHVLGMALRANYGASLPTTWTYKANTLDLETHGTTGVTSGRPPSQTFVFALNGRLSSRTTDGVSEEFRYDGSTGMLDVYKRDPSGTKRIEANFDYDSAGISAMTTVASGTGSSTDWPDIDETFARKLPSETFQIDTHTAAGSSGTTTQTYTYDSSGRVDQVKQNGSVVRDFDWNSFNLPTRVAYSNPNVTRTFAYDAFGSRVKKTQDATNEVLYLGKLYEARNLSGNRESVFRLYADVGLVAEIAHPWGSTTARTTRYLFTDHQGSPAFQVVENGATRVSTPLGFFPFGKRQNTTTAPTQKFSQIGYTGHVQDDDLGLVDMEGRVFDTTTRRFLTRDRVTDRPLNVGGPNPYSYVGNDPVNMVDPSGFQAVAGCCDGIDEDDITDEVVIIVPRSEPDDPVSNDDDSTYNPDEMCGPAPPPSDDAAGGSDDFDPFGSYDPNDFSYGSDPMTGAVGPGAIKHALVYVYLSTAAAVVAAETALLVPLGIVGAKSAAGQGPVRVGQAGEAAVRAVFEIGQKVPIQVAGRTRIPDGLTSTVLTEVKNVQSLSNTQQLRDFASYASQNGLRFDLFVRPTTQLSGPLGQAVTNGTINLRTIP
jgi:RHS repeat-associated protein